MARLFLTLLYISVLTSLTESCLFRDTSLCPARTPLIFGGGIQPQDPDNLLWENGRKLFVFQLPPQGHMGSHMGFDVRGTRGVIRIGQKRCAGSSEDSPICPVTSNYDVTCHLQGKCPCTSDLDPLYFSSITSTGFHAEWYHLDALVCGRTTISEYTLQIRELGVAGEFRNITTAVLNVDVDGLTPDTTHEVRLVPISRSRSTELAPTRLQIIKTLCGIPESPNISVVETTSRAATIHIQIPPTQDWRCNSITIHFQEEVGGEWVDVKELDPSDTENIVDNLIPCLDYKYRIQLSNDNERVYSDFVTVHTKAEVLGPIRNITADDRSNGTVMISWLPPDNSSNMCPVDWFELKYIVLQYQACSGSAKDELQRQVTTNETSYLLQNLSPFTRYNINISAIVSEDYSLVSHMTDTQFTTSRAVPAKLLRVWLASAKGFVTSTSLQFRWQKPGCDKLNGQFIRYVLGGNSTMIEVEITRIGTMSFTVQDLQHCTYYSFTVRFENDIGPGPQNEVSGRTVGVGCST